MTVRELANELGLGGETVVYFATRHFGAAASRGFKPETVLSERGCVELRSAIQTELKGGASAVVAGLQQDPPESKVSIPASVAAADPKPTSPALVADVAALSETVAGLLALVVEQQRQIESLYTLIDASTMARLQVQVTQLARDDFRDRVEEAREILVDIARTGGEFSVGEIEHHGTLTIQHNRSAKESHTSGTDVKEQAAKKFDVDVELKGLVAKLAGIKTTVGLDLSTVRERLERLDSARTHKEESRIEGTFKTRQSGSTFKFGR